MFETVVEKLELFIDGLGAQWQKLVGNKRGTDDLSGFYWIIGVLLLFFDLFWRNIGVLIIAVIFIGYGLFRCFSPFLFHETENEIFLKILSFVKRIILKCGAAFQKLFHKAADVDKKELAEQIKNKFAPDEETKLQRAEEKAFKKAYYVFECPGCHQKVKIPNRGKKGRVAIVCPACETRFVRMRW